MPESYFLRLSNMKKIHTSCIGCKYNVYGLSYPPGACDICSDYDLWAKKTEKGNNMKREKLFVEYPLCMSYEMALAWMNAGHLLCQEITDEFPECAGIEEIETLEELFSEKELDETDNVHLVPKDPEFVSTKKRNYENILGTKLTYKMVKNTIEHLKKYNVALP